jgi:EAL domain-containing protein (putative c-di-GMP-specific phosphodiesterase class I)
MDTTDVGSAEVEAGLLALSQPPSPECSGRVIQSSLRTLRRHLGMDVGFIGRFEAGCRLFDYVDSLLEDCPVQLRGSDPLEQTYCGRIAEGLVPGLIRDASKEPGVADLEITQRLGIGAYMSVPLHRKGGELLGTICCFSNQPDHSLRERDLGLMRLFADLVSAHMETLLAHEERVGHVRATVRRVIEAGGPAVVVQPVVDLETGASVGFEALSRFGEVASEVDWDPARWFAEACRAGLGAELETVAVENALALLPRLPNEAVLGVNVSEASLFHAPMVERLLTAPPGRLVVEITEQAQVVSYSRLAEPLRALREAGARIAVDDAGSGYAGLVHILELAPEIVKLDRSLSSGVTEDPARKAMIRAIVTFADNQRIQIVAEGVEESVDASTLRHLGVRLAQGYHFGRPAALPV